MNRLYDTISQETIGKQLKKLRMSHRFTQEHIAEIFFVSRSCWTNYERGVRCPSMDLLQRIAEYFNVDISFLIDEQAERTTDKEYINAMLQTMKFLSRDGKLDISDLSTMHKVMLLEFFHYLRNKEQLKLNIDDR